MLAYVTVQSVGIRFISLCSRGGGLFHPFSPCFVISLRQVSPSFPNAFVQTSLVAGYFDIFYSL